MPKPPPSKPKPEKSGPAPAAAVEVELGRLDDAVVRQVRARLDPAGVRRYRDAYRDGTALRPVRAFSHPGPGGVTLYLLGDGGHRKRGAADAGLASLPCVVTACADAAEAGRRAFAWAARANAAHGVPRSDADKRLTVRHALVRPEFAAASDRRVARACRVTKFLVRKVRLALDRTGELPEAARRDYKPRDGGDAAGCATTPGERSRPGSAVGAGGRNAAKNTPRAGGVDADDRRVDGRGEPVPANLAGVFAARAWFRTAAERLGRLDQEARAAAEGPHGKALAGDPLDELALDLEDAALGIARAAPFAVCPACKGAGCGRCSGWGWLTLGAYGELPADLRRDGVG